MSQSYAKTLGMHFALIEKRRFSPNKNRDNHLIGDLDKINVLIIDDMIDTAGTISMRSGCGYAEWCKICNCSGYSRRTFGPSIQRLNLNNR